MQKIIYLADDETELDITAEYLLKHDIEVLTASTVVEAQEIIKEETIIKVIVIRITDDHFLSFISRLPCLKVLFVDGEGDELQNKHESVLTCINMSKSSRLNDLAKIVKKYNRPFDP